MILAIDCGNTHTVFGTITKEGEIQKIFRMESSRRKTSYEYAADIAQICQLLEIDLQGLEGSILSSVVPELTTSYQKAMELLCKGKCVVVNSSSPMNMSFAMADPSGVAPDLIISAVGAKNNYPLPAIIIDMGTATTITVVNKEGVFMGGVILPGVGISMNALAKETSLLPSIDVAPAKTLISTDTVDAMRAGIIYGTAGSLDGIVEHFQEELQEEGSVIATGGLAHLICPYCKHEMIVDDNLLLKGLWKIWQLEQGKQG